MPKPRLIKNIGREAVYEFIIESKDFDGMERALYSLPKELRRTLLGSGYCFGSSVRDHHYRCRGFTRAQHIVNHYKRVIGKRKRNGVKVAELY